jgi:uncharacterized protein YjdB
MRCLRVLLHLLIVTVTTSCGNGPESDPFVPVPPKTGITGISVAPGAASLSVGDTVRFRATLVLDVPSLDSTLLWSSDRPGVALVDSVGVATAIAPGVATIIVTWRSNQNFKAGAQVNVH